MCYHLFTKLCSYRWYNWFEMICTSARIQKGLTGYCFKFIDRPFCLRTDVKVTERQHKKVSDKIESNDTRKKNLGKWSPQYYYSVFREICVRGQKGIKRDASHYKTWDMTRIWQKVSYSSRDFCDTEKERWFLYFLLSITIPYIE